MSGCRSARAATAGTTRPAAALGNEPITTSPRTSVLGGEVGLGSVELGQDAIGGGHEAVRGGGEPDAPAVALEQRDAGLALELCERLRDRGRRVADHAGHLGDRAASRELAQEPQPSQVEHQLSLR